MRFQGHRRRRQEDDGYSNNKGSTTQARLRLETAGSGNTIGGILTNTAGNNANLITGGANARGAAAISGANSITGGVNTALNQYMSQQSLDKILKANAGNNVNSWLPSTNYGLG
jgi:hypothetical protein